MRDLIYAPWMEADEWVRLRLGQPEPRDPRPDEVVVVFSATVYATVDFTVNRVTKAEIDSDMTVLEVVDDEGDEVRDDSTWADAETLADTSTDWPTLTWS